MCTLYLQVHARRPGDRLRLAALVAPVPAKHEPMHHALHEHERAPPTARQFGWKCAFGQSFGPNAQEMALVRLCGPCHRFPLPGLPNLELSSWRNRSLLRDDDRPGGTNEDLHVDG